MLKVIIVGTGNVSFHLEKAFSQSSNVQVTQVLPSRSTHKNRTSSRDKKNIEEADILIIAVSDDAISTVAAHFKNSTALVVHTSGSVSINKLPNDVRSGVFYPLQTFSKARQVDFKSIPLALEAKQPEDLVLLRKLAQTITNEVHEINSKQRKALHLAAVFINNFTNHMYDMGHEICEENEVSFDLLKPLINETAAKIQDLNPKEAQTGPAKRHDRETIKEHLSLLKVEKQKAIYTLLTQSIKDSYGEKL